MKSEASDGARSEADLDALEELADPDEIAAMDHYASRVRFAEKIRAAVAELRALREKVARLTVLAEEHADTMDALTAARAAGRREGMEEAAGAMCEDCARGDVPVLDAANHCLRHSRGRGNWCDAEAIRALLSRAAPEAGT